MIAAPFDASIGFTQRGCRLKCGFCVVPKKEGKPRAVNTIADIWRGEPWRKHLHLLDNYFLANHASNGKRVSTRSARAISRFV